MQLKWVKSIVPAGDSLNKVTALAWAPNSFRFAVVGLNRIVYLYDENCELKDKFPTKPADGKTSKNYIIEALAFSPDSTKLAVAQSDEIVYIYKVGAKWGEKKSICNKFPQSSPITCMTWPSSHQSELFFGLAEGKVKLGNTRNNKSVVVYGTEEYVVSICSNPEGSTLAAGHLDGSIYVFSVSSTGAVTKTKLVQHSCIPYCLSWGESIMAAGNDLKVIFYDVKGSLLQRFDYSHDAGEKEYTIAEFSPSGQSVVLGSFNNPKRSEWEEAGVNVINNFYSISALGWKKDGSRFVVANVTGAVELYDACLRRYKYKGKFEMVYVSPSRVIVKRLSSGEKILLGSTHNYEVTKVNVYNDRYVVAHTQFTLLMGDLGSKKKLMSEIAWTATGSEKFFFDNPGVCMIYNAGELTLVEYGNNEPIGLCRTEHVNHHLISVRISEKEPEVAPDPDDDASQVQRENLRVIAYLVDQQTIHIDDLGTNNQLASISHDSKIDWLELNPRAGKLLFRDKRRSLNLFDIATSSRTTLINLVSYVQWVPRTDVVVAQSRSDLCVWYNISAPEKISMFPMKGDIIDIERTKGKTEVVIDEGVQTIFLALNEPLIAFGVAVEAKKYGKAMDILEGAPPSPETEAMWATLAELTLAARQLHVAERSYAAVANVAKARYIRKVNKIAAYAERELGIAPGTDYFVVRARLEILDKNFKKAEMAYIEQGQVEDAMEMYQDLHKWEEAIRVAEANSHPEVANLRRNYYQWLIETRQEERAGTLKEREGDYFEAVNLYLKGGLPAKAAAVVISQNMLGHGELLEKIAEALFLANLFEKAGYFFEKLANHERALESYRKGHAFRPAVELARVAFPNRVLELEGEWGDYLSTVGQLDQAINHFIEANQYARAIDCAIQSSQWTKAVSIVDNLEPTDAKTYYKLIARHYEETLAFELAEKFFVKSGMPEEAVEMYTRANMWDAAHKLAVSYMTQRDVSLLYISQAQKLEVQGKYKDAEKLYITVGEQDQAINMYKKAHKFDDMIRLVTTYHKDLLNDTHTHLAQQLEAEGQYKQAEYHYAATNDWKSAVNMYRANDLWEEALRVAKQYGGQTAATQVSQVWARTLGSEAGVNLLLKFGLIEAAVDFAIEINNFKKAEEICRTSLKRKLQDVYLKHAMLLEDERSFGEAEAEFIKAGSPKDAIDMYIHQADWVNALRVAESFDPPSVLDVYDAQAQGAEKSRDWARAESLFVAARKPEEAVRMYKTQQMWSDAARVTREHMADKLVSGFDQGKELGDVDALVQNQQFNPAIDLLLKRTTETSADHDALEEAWETAVKLAMNHVPDRVTEVVRTVSRRLAEIRRYQQAAELLESIDAFKEAIDVYIQGEMWEQARALAASKAPEYADDVAETKLTVLIDRGEWDKALEIASSQGLQVLGKYSALRVNKLMQENKFGEGVKVLVQWGAAPIPENCALYKQLSKAILSLPAEKDSDEVVVLTRKMLFKLAPALRDFGANESYINEFEKLQMIAHLLHQRFVCKANALPQLASKVATALVRYCGDIPADKAFYEAGMACKDQGQFNMAFVFLNRYLDFSEVMEGEEAAVIENADFERTDVPYDIALPTQQYLSEAKREDARSWVLQASLDDRYQQVLSVKPCEVCTTEIYEASCLCWQCKTTWDTCIVTGYPVLKAGKINCTSCGKAANRDDWNKYLAKFKTCPWCENPQTPSY